MVKSIINILKESGTGKYKKREDDSSAARSASGYGDIIYMETYGIKSYRDYIRMLPRNGKIHCKFMDIGAATGWVSEFILKEKLGTLIANDISLMDLATFRGYLKAEEREGLLFNINPFPYAIEQDENSFDVIMMSHVLHYLSGQRLVDGLRKIYKWLKPGGKLIVQALTPFSYPFFWRHEKAEVLFKEGIERWPGWYINENEERYEGKISDEECNQSFMPSFGHPIHPEILERELKATGFEIEYLNYYSMNFPSLESLPISYVEYKSYVMRPSDESKLSPQEQETIQKIRAKIEPIKFTTAKNKCFSLLNLLDEDHERFWKIKNNPSQETRKIQSSLFTMDGVVAIVRKKK